MTTSGAHAQLFQTRLIRSHSSIPEVVCCVNVKITAKNGKPLGALPFCSRKPERFLREHQAPAECKIAYTSEDHYRWLPKQHRKVVLNDRSEAKRARQDRLMAAPSAIRCLRRSTWFPQNRRHP